MPLISKTEQTFNEARATIAVNDDDIYAGYNDTANSTNAPGKFISFPIGASLGSFSFFASNQGGNYASSLTNAALAQATAFTLPDPGAATAKILLDTSIQNMAAGSQLNAAKVNGTEAANAVTASAQAGQITTSSLTTAGGSSYAITWTNTHITSSSVIMIQGAGGTNTTKNYKVEVVAGNGTATLTIYNLTASTALNGTIILDYLVM